MLSIPIALLGILLVVVAIYVGSDIFVAWIMGNALLARLVMLMFAAFFILIAAFGLFGILAGNNVAAFSRAKVLLAFAVLVLIAMMGIGMLYAALSYESAGPAF